MKPFAALALLGLALAGGARAAPAAGDRAVWVWERESYAMVESQAAADRAFAFMHARGIDVLYLYADAWQGRTLVADDAAAYRRFIARAHAEGLRVYALLGSAALHTEEYVLPARRRQARAMFRRVLDYNAAAAPGARFDGVNYDIEPHLLDAWDTRREALLRGFLDMAADFDRLRRRAGQPNLAVGPAMPFWWDNIRIAWRGRTRPMSEHVADLGDYVALMDYRNAADGRDGIVAHAREEMAYAARAGRKVVIGLDFTPGDPPKTSFHGLGEADLARTLAATAQAYAGDPAFGGFAFHHYRAYADWLDAQPAQAPAPQP